MGLDNRPTLEERLAKALPQGCHFTVHHLSTPPTRCSAIFAAPPREQPDETYCESQFLSLSIDADGTRLQVFAIEVLIYTTECLTTLFVSKADSTGYLRLLRFPPGKFSPLRIISMTFLEYLIQERRRPGRRLILSLFARAQNQYLFPGSAENNHKHVLDDRGLIKWWCKVVDSILETYQNVSEGLMDKQHSIRGEESDIKSHGFLRVPGCDTYETRTFLPKGEWGRTCEEHRWSTTDPLRELSTSPDLPERCLIPRFPDDPKARFVEQLDDELPDEESRPSSSAGRWRSVKSLEQFWDMMQFRQECSSGRLVGFLWAIFQPAKLCGAGKTVKAEQSPRNPARNALPIPMNSHHQDSSYLPPQSPFQSSPAPELSSKTPPISPSNLSPARTPAEAKESVIQAHAEETRYYYWPRSSRGEVILREKDYVRAGNLLLSLDYANEKIAADSTRKWIDDVAERARVHSWGRIVVGENAPPAKTYAGISTNPTMLSAGLVRKKKRAVEDLDAPAIESVQSDGIPAVSTLSSGLVRKKPKVASHLGQVLAQAAQRNRKAEPG